MILKLDNLNFNVLDFPVYIAYLPIYKDEWIDAEDNSLVFGGVYGEDCDCHSYYDYLGVFCEKENLEALENYIARSW